jgi:hypothetical protein
MKASHALTEPGFKIQREHFLEFRRHGRASRRLRVAQSALSHQIQDLEEQLSFNCSTPPARREIDRSGKLFLEAARRVLQELSEAVVRAGRVGPLLASFIAGVPRLPEECREARGVELRASGLRYQKRCSRGARLTAVQKCDAEGPWDRVFEVGV